MVAECRYVAVRDVVQHGDGEDDIEFAELQCAKTFDSHIVEGRPLSVVFARVLDVRGESVTADEVDAVGDPLAIIPWSATDFEDSGPDDWRHYVLNEVSSGFLSSNSPLKGLVYKWGLEKPAWVAG